MATPGKKQSISKLTQAGTQPRKSLKMGTTWKQLNVKKSHSKGRGRNTRRG
ncbi:MAG TPA: hypothetical protein VFI41_04870 [Gemmatimonadales bacterium]|nr:hypothetical protein [Gemmatimonadales bacterium]